MIKTKNKGKNEVYKLFNEKIRGILEKLKELEVDIDSLALAKEDDYGNDVPKLNRIIGEQALELNSLKRKNTLLNTEVEKLWKPK